MPEDLAQQVSKYLEIERKFLLTTLPTEVDSYCDNTLFINQYYLPNTGITERVTEYTQLSQEKEVTKYTRTIKFPLQGQLIRLEKDDFVSKETFETFKSLSVSKIFKKRYKFYGWEYDIIYETSLQTTLYIAEIELPTADFDIPSIKPTWLDKYIVKEITEDPVYSSENLAVKI